MESLLTSVYVLRQIALHKPNAHRAFLAHRPYCQQYNTKGGIYELVCAWGEWYRIYNPVEEPHDYHIYSPDYFRVSYVSKYNFKHPFMPYSVIIRKYKRTNDTEEEPYAIEIVLLCSRFASSIPKTKIILTYFSNHESGLASIQDIVGTQYICPIYRSVPLDEKHKWLEFVTRPKLTHVPFKDLDYYKLKTTF